MKKFNYLCGAAFACAAMFMVSCSVHDDPVPNNDEPQYEVLFTYDFAAAAAAGENPAKQNGSKANGQAFYAWEKADKTDSQRQTYRGYTWAEGSVLPEECHVWRQDDNINGNIVEGGLKCANDKKSLAVDGLAEGYIVEIFYDATNATDDAKDVIWAAAVNAEGAVHGATATIDGVEAVSGETKIASGAKIEVKTCEPTDNGTTGYIVVQVRKNMIIKKIVISKKA